MKRSLEYSIRYFFLCPLRLLILIPFLLLSGCSPRMNDSYVREYQYLRDIREASATSKKFKNESEYVLVVLVEARHLDYSSPDNFFNSMRYGLFLPQEPTIGHAWIILSGKIDGKPWSFEGGHTGEFGLTAPRYFDEVIRRSLEEDDPNPAAYLFKKMPDRYLQDGSGNHSPTYAAAFPLTEEGFLRVFNLLKKYDFSEWSLQQHQCVHFVLACLATVGVDLSCERTLLLPQQFEWNGRKIRLWNDPAYSCLRFPTPDDLERKLFEKVSQSKAYLVQVSSVKNLLSSRGSRNLCVVSNDPTSITVNGRL
jgi:hypothetical protein